MKFEIRKAERRKAKLRAALIGISGSGKTYSALLMATGIVGTEGKICVIDTENGSADLYANQFNYDVLELNAPFSPLKYIDAIKAIEDAAYDVIIIDSLSHAWNAEGGILDMTDNAAKASRSQNSYTAWKETTPIHNKMLQAILQSKCHVIATMRCKTHYDMQEGSNGKKSPVKVGLAPIQRDGMEYEFTVIFDIQQDHYCLASKDRTSIFKDPFIPSVETGEKIKEWLETGTNEEEIITEIHNKYWEEIHGLNDVESLRNKYIEAKNDYLKYFNRCPKSRELFAVIEEKCKQLSDAIKSSASITDPKQVVDNLFTEINTKFNFAVDIVSLEKINDEYLDAKLSLSSDPYAVLRFKELSDIYTAIHMKMNDVNNQPEVKI